MIFNSLFTTLPIWGVFLFTLLATALAFEIGYQLGSRKKDKLQHTGESPLSSSVGASLALLAFILAFTFSMAASRYEERKELVLEEANAIGTTYLRAGYLQEPFSSNIRNLLKEYLADRIEIFEKPVLPSSFEKSEQLQDQLWKLTEEIAKTSPQSVPLGLFISSLNDVIDLHTKRITRGYRNRIPETIWDVLVFSAFLAIMGMGYHSGLNNNRYFAVNIGLILTFSIAIVLIADLDRPQQGWLKISQRPNRELLQKLMPKV